MDVVLRTPNGDAELSIGSHQQAVTLADLVETVTGRAAPAVVYVDDRAVPAVTAIGTAGVLIGSVISTVDDLEPAPIDGVVELVQIAGVGSGARRWLTPGRYRIGIGRRLNAVELDLAPVDTALLELDVESDGSIAVRSSAGARLDGVPVTSPTRWESGVVDVGGRVFALGRRDPRTASAGGHRFVGVAVDGAAAFNRPPRLAAPADFEPLAVPEGAAAVRDARRFPLLTMLAPIPIAVVMAVVLTSPTFLLFGLMSPVMAGANWMSERRNRRRDVDDSTAPTARRPTSSLPPPENGTSRPRRCSSRCSSRHRRRDRTRRHLFDRTLAAPTWSSRRLPTPARARRPGVVAGASSIDQRTLDGAVDRQ